MNLAPSPYISMVYIRLGEVNVMDLEVGCVRHVSFRRQRTLVRLPHLTHCSYFNLSLNWGKLPLS